MQHNNTAVGMLMDSIIFIIPIHVKPREGGVGTSPQLMSPNHLPEPVKPTDTRVQQIPHADDNDAANDVPTRDDFYSTYRVIHSRIVCTDCMSSQQEGDEDWEQFNMIGWGGKVLSPRAAK